MYIHLKVNTDLVIAYKSLHHQNRPYEDSALFSFSLPISPFFMVSIPSHCTEEISQLFLPTLYTHAHLAECTYVGNGEISRCLSLLRTYVLCRSPLLKSSFLMLHSLVICHPGKSGHPTWPTLICVCPPLYMSSISYIHP